MQSVDIQGYLVIQNLQGIGHTMTKKNCTCKQAQFLSFIDALDKG